MLSKTQQNFSKICLSENFHTIKSLNDPNLLSKKSNLVNPFYVTNLFQYRLKTSENLWFSVFWGALKKISGMRWVNTCCYQSRLWLKSFKTNRYSERIDAIDCYLILILVILYLACQYVAVYLHIHHFRIACFIFGLCNIFQQDLQGVL